MNINDFRYMWQGQPIKTLTGQECYLLDPIHKQGKANQHALLLLHGFSSSPAVYRLLLPALQPLYDTIICPVLPGHADSLAAFSITKATAWITTAEKACEQLINTHRHVDVLGLSLGGLLACHLSQHFGLHHLYLLAPALVLNMNLSCALAYAHVLHWLGFQYLRNQAGNLQGHEHCELAYRQLPITTVIELLTLIQSFHFTAPTCPTDLFLGQFDKVINGPLVAARFNTLSNTTLHWLPNSAHVLPLDTDRELIIQCVQGHFISKATTPTVET